MPLEYFDSNINGMISVLKAMKSQRVKRLVFSSSATVYGEPEYLPLDENHVTRAINPYGRCKLHIEEILSDLSKSDSEWDIVCLRYFNPAGAHTSSLIGEDPRDEPTNLMPIIAQVANGEIPYINIFGSDYDTKDGTGVRDYIHVMDLADGHVAALNYLSNNSGWSVINLGTGIGYSVLEMIKTYEKVSGKKIKYKFVDKRAGDTATCYAKVDRALKFLRWEAKYNLTDMCFSSWEFKKKYPL
jgi:UDP-glucose 4-epimerase